VTPKSLTFCMLVTQSALSHIRKLDRAFGACVHEPIAALWVELRSCNDLCQFLHVSRLDIDNVENFGPEYSSSRGLFADRHC